MSTATGTLLFAVLLFQFSIGINPQARDGSVQQYDE